MHINITYFIVTGIASLIFSFGILSAQVAAGSEGRISGLIVSDDGVPLQGARILYSSSAPVSSLSHQPFHARASVPAKSGVVPVDDTGSFDIAALPVGRYVLCADFPARDEYLDGCMWGQPATIVHVEGPSRTTAAITASAASIVEIRVDDPKRLIKSTPFDTNLNIGVFSDQKGWFYGARSSVVAEGGVIYTIKVPVGEPLRLSVDSSELQYELAGEPFRDPSTVTFLSDSEPGGRVRHDLRVTSSITAE